LALCVALGAGAPGQGEPALRQQLVYSEDFTGDPGYSSATELYHVTGASFPIATGFNRLYIGEISQPPMYGEHSAIRVDNIEIWSGQVAVNETSRGAIKGAYR
jgi:hypothetical protein